MNNFVPRSCLRAFLIKIFQSNFARIYFPVHNAGARSIGDSTSPRSYSTRARAAPPTTLISMGFTSLLPPPMTSWKVISCPINFADSRAELRRIYDVWNRWFGCLVALRHTDDFLSERRKGMVEERPHTKRGIASLSCDIHICSRNNATSTGRLVHLFCFIRGPARIPAWIATKFAYLTPQLAPRVSFIYFTLFRGIYRPFTNHMCIHLGGYTASMHCWKPYYWHVVFFVERG